MNSLERTLAAVTFAPLDRMPVMPQVFGHAAAVAGVSLDDYIRDGELLARSQLLALERYGYDAVFAVMDVNVETEALGSTLKFRKNQYADIETFALAPADRWDRLTLPDPEHAGRMPEMLKALRLLRRELDNRVPIVGCVMGPLTLATQLLGIETALYQAIDAPERFSQLLDFATEVLIRFGLAQLQAGAHLPIVFDPSASPAVVPPAFFREFELPRLTRLFSAFKQAGALANWLHIAGPTDTILALYPHAGVDIANFDYCVPASTAQEKLPRTCVDGNVKPLAFVASQPSQVAAEAAQLVQGFAGRGGFILSSGCEIPAEANPENIAALVQAAQRSA
jgi:uroporphyrinogen decarboxylase